MAKHLDSEVDALFALPLTEFTAARNALAARLKREGRAADAERVKTIAKPPISAWAVNQLHHKHRDAFARLIAAGRRFREAQASQLAGKGGDIQKPRDARREAISESARLAAGLLRDADHNPTQEIMRRITTTLEGISAYETLPEGAEPGRLTQDIDPPGFETLAALMPNRPEKAKVVDIRETRKAQQEKIDAAQASLREAETQRCDAQEHLRKAIAVAEDAAKALKRAERAVEQATQRLQALLPR